MGHSEVYGQKVRQTDRQTSALASMVQRFSSSISADPTLPQCAATCNAVR